MNDSIRVRPGRAEDLVALVDIYNYYVRETAITFDLVEFTVETRRSWFEKFDSSGRYRLFVAENGGKVAGYASTSAFRPKAAYDTTIETSVYLDPDARGEGIGAKLYAALFESLKGEDIHRAYAGITLPNEASIKLHERFGFSPIATFEEVGRKFGRYWDVLWLVKALD